MGSRVRSDADAVGESGPGPVDPGVRRGRARALTIGSKERSQVVHVVPLTYADGNRTRFGDISTVGCQHWRAADRRGQSHPFGTNTSGLNGGSCQAARPVRLSMAWKGSAAYPRRAPAAHAQRLDATPCTEQQASKQLVCPRVRPSQREAQLGPIWAQRRAWPITMTPGERAARVTAPSGCAQLDRSADLGVKRRSLLGAALSRWCGLVSATDSSTRRPLL